MSAVEVLAPGQLATPAQFEQFTRSWLDNRRLSVHTRSAYARDVAVWLSWCTDAGVSPLTVKFTHVNTFARLQEQTLAPSSVARRLSAVSSWYAFLVRLGLLAVNPVAGVDRPTVARDDTRTVGLSPQEVDRLLVTAAQRGLPRDHALLVLLADMGLRISEALGLDVADLGWQSGHRTISFEGKGGQRRRRPLPDPTSAVLDRYLAQRAADAGVPVESLTGPLFVTAGGVRMARQNADVMLTRTARRAGLASAEVISLHSLRHAFATAAREQGVSLEAVQDAMGHADPRTTRRYDRDRHRLAADPSHTLAASRSARSAT